MENLTEEEIDKILSVIDRYESEVQEENQVIHQLIEKLDIIQKGSLPYDDEELNNKKCMRCRKNRNGWFYNSVFTACSECEKKVCSTCLTDKDRNLCSYCQIKYSIIEQSGAWYDNFNSSKQPDMFSKLISIKQDRSKGRKPVKKRSHLIVNLSFNEENKRQERNDNVSLMLDRTSSKDPEFGTKLELEQKEKNIRRGLSGENPHLAIRDSENSSLFDPLSKESSTVSKQGPLHSEASSNNNENKILTVPTSKNYLINIYQNAKISEFKKLTRTQLTLMGHRLELGLIYKTSQPKNLKIIMISFKSFLVFLNIQTRTLKYLMLQRTKISSEIKYLSLLNQTKLKSSLLMTCRVIGFKKYSICLGNICVTNYVLKQSNSIDTSLNDLKLVGFAPKEAVIKIRFCEFNQDMEKSQDSISQNSILNDSKGAKPPCSTLINHIVSKQEVKLHLKYLSPVMKKEKFTIYQETSVLNVNTKILPGKIEISRHSILKKTSFMELMVINKTEVMKLKREATKPSLLQMILRSQYKPKVHSKLMRKISPPTSLKKIQELQIYTNKRQKTEFASLMRTNIMATEGITRVDLRASYEPCAIRIHFKMNVFVNIPQKINVKLVKREMVEISKEAKRELELESVNNSQKYSPQLSNDVDSSKEDVFERDKSEGDEKGNIIRRSMVFADQTSTSTINSSEKGYLANSRLSVFLPRGRNMSKPKEANNSTSRKPLGRSLQAFPPDRSNEARSTISTEIFYDFIKGKLSVSVVSASNLVIKNKNKLKCFAQVRIFSGKTKFARYKTKVVKCENDPEWNENFFYSINIVELKQLTLGIKVYEDTLLSKKLLGQSIIPINQIYWKILKREKIKLRSSLVEKRSSGESPKANQKGSITISSMIHHSESFSVNLDHSQTKGILTIVSIEARGLPISRKVSMARVYIYLFHGKKDKMMKKSRPLEYLTGEMFCNEDISFAIDPNKLDEYGIKIKIVNDTAINDVLGILELNNNHVAYKWQKCLVDAAAYWESLKTSMGVPISKTLMLNKKS